MSRHNHQQQQQQQQPTHYTILGLTSTATESHIKSAYYRLALIHHPDKGGNADEFKLISEAYAVLSDPNARSAYDAELNSLSTATRYSGGGGGGGGGDMDMFQHFPSHNPFSHPFFSSSSSFGMNPFGGIGGIGGFGGWPHAGFAAGHHGNTHTTSSSFSSSSSTSFGGQQGPTRMTSMTWSSDGQMHRVESIRHPDGRVEIIKEEGGGGGGVNRLAGGGRR